MVPRLANRLRVTISHAGARGTSERYRLIFDACPSPLLVFASDGRLVEANRAAGDLIGRTAESLAGCALDDLLHADGPENALLSSPASATTEGVARAWLRRADGGRRYVEVARFKVDGHVLVSFSDITARSALERAQRQASAGARCILWWADISDTPANDLQWEMHLADHDAAQRVLPIHVPDGMDWCSAWYLSRLDDDRRRTDDFGTAKIRSSQSYAQEFRCRCADGSVRWLAEDVVVDPISPGRWRAVGVCIDFTERRQAEEAARAAESFYHSLADGLPLNIIVKDLSGRLVFVNSRTVETLGKQRTELIGKSDDDLFPPDLAAKYVADDRRVLDTEEPLRVVEEHRLPTGFRSHVETIKSPMRGPDGSITGLLCVFWDVTDQVQSREAAEHIGAHANCLLWYSVVEEIGDGRLKWSTRFLDEAAAFRCFDVERKQGASFHEAWSYSWVPEDLARAEPRAAASVRAGKGYSWEFRYRTRSGELRWASERVQIEPLGEGRWSATGVCLDITDLKRSQEGLALIASSAECVLWFGDACAAPGGAFDLLISVADEDAAFRIFPVAREEGEQFISAWLRSRVPEDGARADQFGESETRAGRNYRHEFRHLMADGQVRWIAEAVQVETVEPGRWRLVGVCTDITSSKLTQQRVEESEERFRQLAEAVDEVFWSYDPVGRRVEYASPAYERVLGRTCQSLYDNSANYLAFVYPGDKPIAMLALEKQLRGESTDDEYRVVRPDGALRWLRERAFPITDDAGQVYRIVGVAEDVTARKEADGRIQSQFEQLSSLRAIDMAISGSFDLKLTLAVVIEQVINRLQVDAAAILTSDEGGHALSFAAGQGFSQSAIRSGIVTPGIGLIGRALLDEQLVTVDLQRAPDSFERRQIGADEGAVSYAAVPLIAKGRVRGLLEVYSRSPLPSEPQWLVFLEALGGQAAIAIDNAHLFRRLQRSNAELTQAYDATIEGWSRALDLRDKETEGHTRRVTEMTVRLARQMGIPEEEIVHIRRGALLHDIGKMGIPDGILLKPGKLSEEEWQVMRKHPAYAHALLSPIAFLRPALDIPHYHHEKWDGTGYPWGLVSEEIPLAARIFAVVDVWDALRSDRPYRPAWPEARVIEYIRSLAGSHFDPTVVDAFLHVHASSEHVPVPLVLDEAA